MSDSERLKKMREGFVALRQKVIGPDQRMSPSIRAATEVIQTVQEIQAKNLQAGKPQEGRA